MCNAYTVRPKVGSKDVEEVVSGEILKLPQTKYDIEGPVALIRRGGPGVVVVQAEGALTAETMRWGFDHAVYKLVNNARTESLKRGMWTEPMATRRCLVPVTSFFEWQEITLKGRQTHRVWRPDTYWSWVAGLYERTASGEGHYATITTEPTHAFRVIHDRLLGIMDFAAGLEFLHGGPPPTAPFGGHLKWEPCESPLKGTGEQRPKKQPPEDSQGSLF
jgi:putative SOS response-associated peptidase YedK